MDELTAVRSFRSEVPERDDAARATAFAALEAVLAAPAALRPWWRSRRAQVLAAAAALVSVAVVSSAFGWPGRVLDVIAGEPAPPRVKDRFALENEAQERVLPLFRRDRSSGVIVERAHAVLGIETSVGSVILWAAPTRDGGVCWIHELARSVRLGSGCTPPRKSFVFQGYALGKTRIGDGYLDLLDGRVRSDVATVNVQYADGESESIPVLEGFFLHEPRKRPTLLTARDRSGAELHRQAVRSPFPIPVSPLPGPERVLIELTTSSGHLLTFSIASGSNGTLCQITRYRGTVSRGCGIDPRTRVAPDELQITPSLQNEAQDGKPLVTLDGVVGSAIARLELEYEDGTVVPVPVVERFVLFEIPPEHHNDKRFVLVGRNTAGEVIARRVAS